VWWGGARAHIGSTLCRGRFEPDASVFNSSEALVFQARAVSRARCGSVMEMPEKEKRRWAMLEQ
tara:strand:- start:46 stop:237 length:192 start_codon:yes stop_codon:yes gene_type:complete